MNTDTEKKTAVAPSALTDVLEAILRRVEDRHTVMQEHFYSERPLSISTEIRTMLLLDVRVILRDAINDLKASN